MRSCVKCSIQIPDGDYLCSKCLIEEIIKKLNVPVTQAPALNNAGNASFGSQQNFNPFETNSSSGAVSSSSYTPQNTAAFSPFGNQPAPPPQNTAGFSTFGDQPAPPPQNTAAFSPFGNQTAPPPQNTAAFSPFGDQPASTPQQSTVKSSPFAGSPIPPAPPVSGALSQSAPSSASDNGSAFSGNEDKSPT